MSDTQKRIYEAVVARGYKKGYSAEQFLARNVCKMQEELGEVCEHLVMDASGTERVIENAGEEAAWAFAGGNWRDAGIRFTAPVFPSPESLGAIGSELADMFVVLMCMAEALSELEGERVDLAVMALAKAEADVKRGIR